VFAATLAVVTVAVLTLGSGSIIGPARGELAQLAGRVPAASSAFMQFGYAEQLLNVILFVPLGTTIALLLGRRTWPLAIVFGAALSAVVEFAQRTIAGRVPDLGDVLWNTVGAAIGVVAVTLIRSVGAAVRRSVQRGRVTRT
jgi:glycopeptide antibiotics resistance protein